MEQLTAPNAGRALPVRSCCSLDEALRNPGKLCQSQHRSRVPLSFVVTLLAAMGLLLLGLPRDGAGYDEDRERAAELLRDGAIQPLDGFLERARALRAGRVIEVELESEYGRHFYEIELLDDDGHVWEMTFDASSGELVEEEREH